MSNSFRTWRPVLRVLAFALAVAVTPLPSWAGDTSQTAPRPGLKASIAKAAASERLSAQQDKSQATSDGKAALASPSFFRTPVGAVVISVVAAGTAFAAYSLKHDRVHSPNR